MSKYHACDRCGTTVESIKARLDLNYRCPTCNGDLFLSKDPDWYIETDRNKKHCRRCEIYLPLTTTSCVICQGPLLTN